MRGLKTQESDRFNRYWALIQEAAAKKRCVFFGYTGEGRDFSTDTMEGEDFSGWLVPQEHADAFEALWWKDSGELFHTRPLGSGFTFAVWDLENGAITVTFKSYS